MAGVTTRGESAAIRGSRSAVWNRGPKIRDRVHRRPTMPSILAEISFLSNPADEKKLKTGEYRQKIAESLYKGISKYVSSLSSVKVAQQANKAAAQ